MSDVDLRDVSRTSLESLESPNRRLHVERNILNDDLPDSDASSCVRRPNKVERLRRRSSRLL